MKKTLIAIALAAPLLASAATNLLTNGSFESNLTGWTTTTTPGVVYAPLIITYGAGAASGENVPADNAASLSPDAAGTKAVYFVDDGGTLTLSQTFSVATAGTYSVGFSLYAPANGFANPGNATFAAAVDTTSVLSTTVASLGPTQWQARSGTALLTAGSHTIAFTFTTTGGVSKDLIVDRVYVTAVPEAGTMAMLAAGLAVVGGVARRRTVHA